MNKTHEALLKEILALHERKAKDYAHSGDPYANFKAAARVAEGFTGVDAVFATLIGVKLARIRELTAPGRVPNNESLDDSFVDLTNYCAIWTSYRRDWAPIEAQKAENDRRYAELTRRWADDPDPGDVNSPHKYFPKPDGTCMICGLLQDQWGERRVLGCA